ncbi:phage integrase [Enterobacter asburiae]|uniref:phage integrase n=1 Tax=Enterobacter asburiae TaxID=61645 RepID=UPI000F8993D4|nr:tyrosine-type recombinase/integrase [Enterobacter asburiae]RTP91498.1 integrase [Enterobacter asburiae]
MSIKKLEDGRYQVDIRPKGIYGKRVRKIFKTKTEAQAYEKYVLINHHTKEWLDKPADKRPLSELIDLWWVYDGRNQKFGETYCGRLRKVCREMEDPKAYELTRKFLMEYRSRKLNAGLLASSVNRDLFVLSAMFTVLIEAEEFHNENPVRAIRKLTVRSSEMSFLSEDEIDDLLRRTSGDEWRVALLCLATGMRWNEAATLRAEQIIGNRVTMAVTKNGRSRAIPLAPKVVEMVKTKKSGPLFKVDYLQFRQILKELKPDLPKGQATHVLRHTFATHFMMNGGNIVTLQRILGHSNIQQTMVYAHFSPDFLQDAVSYNPIAETVHNLSFVTK